MRLYIAGKMTGEPLLNYPLFNLTASALRAQGHEVTNPAENPEPPCKSWHGYMRTSIPQVMAGIDGIVCLPGWEESKGARLEVHVAKEMDVWVYSVRDFFPEGA